MNDPLSLASDQFSIPRLKAHVIEGADIPATVNLYMTWDLAYSTSEHSRLFSYWSISCGVTSRERT